MRKVEEQMLLAICEGKNFKSPNTTVTWSVGGVVAEVRLHGNLIAKYSLIEGLYVTWAGWVTTTTSSRIRALLTLIGSGITTSTRGGVPYIVTPTKKMIVADTDWVNLRGVDDTDISYV